MPNVMLPAKVKPFMVPNFVLIEGREATTSVTLGSLADKDLDAMCADFRHAILTKARKQREQEAALAKAQSNDLIIG